MKIFFRLWLSALAFIVLLPFMATAQTAIAPNLDALRSKWVQRLEAQDLEGSLAQYKSDATFTNPDGTHVHGVALRNLFQEVFRSFHAKILMTPRSTGFSGSLAYESGSYEEDLTQIQNGERKHVSGDYLTLYRRAEKGAWLIVEQVWTEAPPK